MNSESFSINSRLRSFRFAFQGIRTAFKRDHNLLVHLAATIVVIAMSVYFDTTVTEKLAIVFAIGFVWVTELLNTAIEKAMDIITRGYHPKIKFVKDVSAAAVLIASITSATIGFIIFIPKIITWFA